MQVVKLCRTHRLYSALTYVLTRGLDDYVAPAVELLLALATAEASAPAKNGAASSADPGAASAKSGAAGVSDAEHAASDKQQAASNDAQRAAGFKLLVYLRCCLQQQQFPPGAGPLTADKAGIVKAGVLGDSRVFCHITS